MKTAEAIAKFNESTRELAEALGISTAAVYQWGDSVPELRAYQIREILDRRADIFAPVGADATPSPTQESAVA